MTTARCAARTRAGFTLIEFLITLTIAGILVAAAVPSFQDSIRRSRLTSQINEMVLALNLARSEAVKRGGTVTVCKSSNGTACEPDLEWDSGWIVFVNRDSDSPAVVDAGPPAEEVLRAFPALRAGYTLRSSNGTIPDHVTYRATGVSTSLGTESFVLCEQSTLSYSRAIFISSAGRIKLAADANHDGIPENADGTPIASCTP